MQFAALLAKKPDKASNPGPINAYIGPCLEFLNYRRERQRPGNRFCRSFVARIAYLTSRVIAFILTHEAA